VTKFANVLAKVNAVATVDPKFSWGGRYPFGAKSSAM
jgi:hypothetical protein